VTRAVAIAFGLLALFLAAVLDAMLFAMAAAAVLAVPELGTIAALMAIVWLVIASVIACGICLATRQLLGTRS
jgi:hypothetical protein